MYEFHFGGLPLAHVGGGTLVDAPVARCFLVTL